MHFNVVELFRNVYYICDALKQSVQGLQ